MSESEAASAAADRAYREAQEHSAELKAQVGTGAPDVYFACRNLHAYYGESYIVQGVGFEIPEGKILALLGRNGAGKTSTLRTIARAGSPDLRHGEIWLQGTPVHTLKGL